VAQGNMSFAGISNTGTTTIGQNLVMTGTYNTNYLEFPDGTKQYSASSGTDILDTDNTFIGVNTFSPLPAQTYGATMTQGITLTNNQSSSTTTGDTSIVSYTPSTTTGLEIYSLSNTNNCNGVLPQIQLQPDGTQSKISASATDGLVVLSAVGTGGLIQLNANTGVRLGTPPILDFNSWGKLSSTSTTSGIISDVNFTSPKFIINDDVDDSYQIYSQNANDYGLVISNTSGANGILTISNGSSTLTSLTSYLYALGDIRLDVSTQITVPTQTAYSSSTTYVNVLATQAFVKSAIQSQGGGGASLTANQTFTGVNNFSNYVNFSSIVNETTQFSIGNKLRLTLDTGATFVQSYFELNSDGTTTYSNIINLPSQTYDAGVAYGNVASTQQFVIQALASQGGGDVYLNGTNNFTGTNTFNTNLPSSTIGGVYPNYGTPNSFATIGYVNSLTTTINSTFSGNLGIASIGFPNYMTSHLVGNIIYYSGYIAFVPSGNPSKVSFNINPALNITLQTNIQNASLYSVDTSSYISIDASQTYLFNNALIIQLYGGLSGGTYNFQFSGNAQYS
jgi:hypothetical protein